MTEGAQAATHNPLPIHQRYRQYVENALLAGALAGLVALFLNAAGSYPAPLQMLLLLAVAGLGTRARAWGYYAAVAVLLWPLWQLSPYLLTLFLVITLLPRNWLIDRLPWVLLVASAPLLAQWQVLALVPLLVGLMLGPAAGWWAGAAAALWLVVVGGLAGWLPELGALHGAPFPYAVIRQQAGEANSLQTLALLVAPFTKSTSLLLLHGVQILLWGLAGWLVGRIRRMQWQNGEPRFVLAPTLATGTLTLWVAIFIVPAWLALQPFWIFFFQPTPTVGLALSALTAAVVAAMVEEINRPASRRPSRRRTTMIMGREGPQPSGEETGRRRAHPDRSPEQEDDVIMLELD